MRNEGVINDLSTQGSVDNSSSISPEFPDIQTTGTPNRLAVFKERLRLHMIRHRLGAITGPVVGAYLALIHYDTIEANVLLGWWLALLAIDSTTAVVAHFYLRWQNRVEPGRWLNTIVVLQACTGFVWGSSVYFFRTPEMLALEFYTLTILVAVSSLAALSFLAFRRVYNSFFICMWLFPTLYFYSLGEAIYTSFVSSILSLTLALTVYLSTTTKLFVQGIEQRLRAEDLAQELSQALRKIQKIATTDELTKVFNRRYGLDCLRKEKRIQEREHSSLTILSIDVDRFKSVNDTYGHPIGDVTLVNFAKRVQSLLRSPDTIARFGGEEFLIIMPRTTENEANIVAERLLAEIAGSPMVTDPFPISVTASIGLTEVRPNESVALAISRVDQALYRAKHLGRNRVEVA